MQEKLCTEQAREIWTVLTQELKGIKYNFNAERTRDMHVFLVQSEIRSNILSTFLFIDPIFYLEAAISSKEFL